MYIKELNRKDGFTPTSVVTLDYDEVRTINNCLYKLSKLDDFKKDEDFLKARKNFYTLFTLLKHGTLPAFEVGVINKLVNEINGESDCGLEE